MAKDNGKPEPQVAPAPEPKRCPKCGANMFRLAQFGQIVDERFVVTESDALCVSCGMVVTVKA